MSLLAADDAPRPTFVIRARQRSLKAYLRDLYHARFMFTKLTAAAATMPYQNLALGVVWTMIRPLIFLAVIVFIKQRSGADMGEEVPYVLFVLSGLVLWWYFVDAARASSRSLQRYRGLITKIYFPRAIAPAIPVFARFYDLGFQALVLVGFMIAFGLGPGPAIAALPLVLVAMFMLSLGVGYLFAALGAYVRDLERVLDNTLYVAFFVSPVIYSTNLIPEAFHTPFMVLNPMAGVLEAARMSLFSTVPFDWQPLAIALGVSAVWLIVGLLVFLRLEEEISERVL
jgi:lipopolysaccharide transport system permease protein